MAGTERFGFVQFEFGFLLGPPNGRYVIRDGAASEPRAVLVLSTLGATQRRPRRERRGKTVTEASPAAVPTSRATVVKPEPFGSDLIAKEWLDQLQDDREAVDAEVREATVTLNRAIHAHRIARLLSEARDVAIEQALVVRLGFGAGEAVAEGRYATAWELPAERQVTPRRSVDPNPNDERFAALLSGSEKPLASEELVLRAASDIASGRYREGALEARIALEALLAELGPSLPEQRRAALEDDRGPIGDAANAALQGGLSEQSAAAVRASTGRMRAALEAYRA